MWEFEDKLAEFTLFFLIFGIGLGCVRINVIFDCDFPYDSDTCNVLNALRMWLHDSNKPFWSMFNCHNSAGIV